MLKAQNSKKVGLKAPKTKSTQRTIQKRKLTTTKKLTKKSILSSPTTSSLSSFKSTPTLSTFSSYFSTDATTTTESTHASTESTIPPPPQQQMKTTKINDLNAAPEYYMGPDLYTLRPTNVREGARIIRAFCNTPTDQPISFSMNLGLDPRKPNQSVRGMAPVPHGSGGKTVLAVFATGDKAIEAKEAGADIVGAEDLIKEIMTGKIEFTRCVATPDMMKHLSKVARILGPKGLMPNPKLGTVTTDIRTAVENSKQGQIEFRNDKKGVVHAIVGKSSWSPEKLEENINAFVRAIADAKPSGAKGQYFKSAYIGNNSGWSQSIDIRLYPFKA